MESVDIQSLTDEDKPEYSCTYGYTYHPTGVYKRRNPPDEKNAMVLLHDMHPELKYQVSKSGPDHAPLYRVEVYVNNTLFVGESTTKKAAKLDACKKALKSFVQCQDVEGLQEARGWHSVDADYNSVFANDHFLHTSFEKRVYKRRNPPDEKNAMVLLHDMHPELKYQVSKSGPDHAPLYRVEVYVNNTLFVGESTTKKAAKLDACKKALNSFVQCQDLESLQEARGWHPVDADYTSVLANDHFLHTSFEKRVYKRRNSRDEKNAMVLLHDMHPELKYQVSKSGPDHAPLYRVEVYVNNTLFVGESTTKKAAKLDACKKALKSFVQCQDVEGLQEARGWHPVDADYTSVFTDDHFLHTSFEKRVYKRRNPPDEKNAMVLLHDMHPELKYQVSKSGPDHAPLYRVEVYVNNTLFVGESTTKKAAKLDACKKALESFVQCQDVEGLQEARVWHPVDADYTSVFADDHFLHTSFEKPEDGGADHSSRAETDIVTQNEESRNETGKKIEASERKEKSHEQEHESEAEENIEVAEERRKSIVEEPESEAENNKEVAEERGKSIVEEPESEAENNKEVAEERGKSIVEEPESEAENNKEVAEERGKSIVEEPESEAENNKEVAEEGEKFHAQGPESQTRKKGGGRHLKLWMRFCNCFTTCISGKKK